MLLRKNLQHPTLLMLIGMSFLLAGTVAFRGLPAVGHVQSDIADGLGGLCYGIAFACLLLSVREGQRRR